MKRGISGIVLMMLVLGFCVGGDLRARESAKPVEVDGNCLSVHADGMPLGDLLVIVERITGVQFTYDESVAERKVFLDFKGLVLSEGIKKIVYPLNCAAIYDDAGKLRKVVILGRWKDSVTRQLDEGGDEPPRSERAIDPSTEPRRSESSVAPERPPLGKRPARLGRSSRDTSSSKDEKRDKQEQAMEGPPVKKAYSMNGPSNTQNQKLEGPPNTGSADLAPSLDSKPDSKGLLMDGPPVDRPYVIDGPPGWKD